MRHARLRAVPGRSSWSRSLFPAASSTAPPAPTAISDQQQKVAADRRPARPRSRSKSTSSTRTTTPRDRHQDQLDAEIADAAGQGRRPAGRARPAAGQPRRDRRRQVHRRRRRRAQPGVRRLAATYSDVQQRDELTRLALDAATAPPTSSTPLVADLERRARRPRGQARAGEQTWPTASSPSRQQTEQLDRSTTSRPRPRPRPSSAT